jgi:hypothetical protein
MTPDTESAISNLIQHGRQIKLAEHDHKGEKNLRLKYKPKTTSMNAMSNETTVAPQITPPSDGEEVIHAAPTTLPEAAEYYAITRRWPIFPCKPGGKEPLVPKGVNAATTDAAQVRCWWRDYPNANIGLATGRASGLIVLDVDGEDGRRSLAAMQKLPHTLTARTGRVGGGMHQYFACDGHNIRNSTGRLGTGLDVRGAGGYVILPPSLHKSGATYEWADRCAIATLPSWLACRMLAPRPQHEKNIGAERPSTPLIRRAIQYAQKAEAVGQGQRNNACFGLAGHLAALVGDEGERLAVPEIEKLVQTFADRCVPQLSEGEVKKCVASAMRNGTPRALKPARQARSQGRKWNCIFDV